MLQKQSETAQSYTLESIAVFTLFIAVILLANALYSVEIFQENTTQAEQELQNENIAESLIITMQQHNTLSKSIRTWDVSEDEYYNTGDQMYYQNSTPPTELGQRIQDLQDRGYNTNISFSYSHNGNYVTQDYIDFGKPSSTGAVYTTNVALYNSENLLMQNGNPSGTTLSEEDNFIIEDNSNTYIYNVVTVKIEVWKN